MLGLRQRGARPGGARGCPWSRAGKPVEGWQALRRDLRVRTGSEERTESYLVLRCPLFQPDPPRARLARTYLVRRVKKDGAGRVFLGPETRFVSRDDLPTGGFCLLGSQRRQWCFVVRELHRRPEPEKDENQDENQKEEKPCGRQDTAGPAAGGGAG